MRYIGVVKCQRCGAVEIRRDFRSRWERFWAELRGAPCTVCAEHVEDPAYRAAPDWERDLLK